MIGMLRSGQKQDIETGAALGRSGFLLPGDRRIHRQKGHKIFTFHSLTIW